MRPATLFLIASVLALAFGLGFLIAPATVLSMYGVSTDPSTILLSRFFGAALVHLGLAVYFLREVREPRTVRALALSGAGAGDFRALDRLGALPDAAPASSATVSGPLSGKLVAQLLTQTS